jgi:hypothetical protein
MQVKNFINAFGIEKLNGKSVEQNGKVYKIVLSADDLEYHSIENSDWNGSKERLDSYHSKGNYRFYAMDENEMCVWVYPTTDLVMDNEVVTEYGRVAIINENGKKKVDFNNSKFNSTMDFIGFLKNETLTTQILGY